MKPNIARRPFVIFNVLVAYVLIQLVWWAWLIISLMHTVYGDTSEYESKFRMILGEGLVFVILLVIGIIITTRMFRKEIWLNHQQRNFLLSVTHELRTPLATTRLALETLENRELTPEKRKEITQRALNENARLTNLIDNILLSASFENPGYRIHREETDVSVLCTQVVQSLAHSIGKNHNTEISIQPGIKRNVDKMLFPSVISNLYENAVKYSPAGSTIVVSLQQTDNMVILSIADQGVGIDLKNQQRIFEKFFRTQDENTRTVKGTGLGLYLTRIICAYHQYEIRVEKNHPEGSVFRVSMKN
jgi:two-component system, OmpR family, phosphate regulon sensor histidine kinase PhoR